MLEAPTWAPSNPSRKTEGPHRLLTYGIHSAVPHVHDVAIKVSLAGNCWSRCIWQVGIFGYKVCSIRLGGSVIAQHIFADANLTIFHRHCVRSKPRSLCCRDFSRACLAPRLWVCRNALLLGVDVANSLAPFEASSARLHATASRLAPIALGFADISLFFVYRARDGRSARL